MVARSIAVYRSLLKVLFVYVVVRVFLTAILLVSAGYKVPGVFGDSIIFGGGGGGGMAAFAMCLCIFFNPAQYKVRRIYISILKFSIVYYVAVNAFFLIVNREGYFLLTLYAGLKYEMIFIISVYIFICFLSIYENRNH